MERGDRRGPRYWLRRLFQRLVASVGALVLGLGCFLVLPLMQAITKPPEADLLLREADVAELPPPEEPPELRDEPEPEPEPEEPPPELSEETSPLDLSQLEAALNPGFGEGWLAGELSMDLSILGGGGEGLDALYSDSELDQEPRVVYQPSPVVTAKLRKAAPGNVVIAFTVDPKGRVEDPIVMQSTDPVFERAALAAVKQWRFEPGKRGGEPVRFKKRVPITFPRGL